MSKRTASLLAIASGVIWSLGSIHVRLAHRSGSDAFQYMIWRSIAVLVVVEVLARRKRLRSPLLRAYTGGWVMWVANAMLLIASLAFVYAVDINGAAQTAFLSSMTPLFAVVVARVFLGERLTPVMVGALALGIVGLTIMVGGQLGGGHLIGNIAAISSSFGFAGYAACVRSDRTRDWSPVLPGYALLMIVLCTAVTLARGRDVVPGARPIVLAIVHGGVYIVVGTLLFNLGARYVPAAAMAVFAQSEMVFVPIWAALLLAERPPARTVFGAAIVLSAIVINAVWGHRGSTATSPRSARSGTPQAARSTT